MTRDGPSDSDPGYSSAMATDAVFHMFPEPGDLQVRSEAEDEDNRTSEMGRFMQRQYPMLYMNLNARECPSVVDVQYEDSEGDCPLCELDRNTLDSIKVLKPREVRAYLDSCDHSFTEKQVNVHLAHTTGDDDVIEVLRNMSVDLISKSYSLANAASLRVMNRFNMHRGRPLFVPDQALAKVHNDAVKQFIGLASTCQALMKYKRDDSETVASERRPLL